MFEMNGMACRSQDGLKTLTAVAFDPLSSCKLRITHLDMPTHETRGLYAGPDLMLVEPTFGATGNKRGRDWSGLGTCVPFRSYLNGPVRSEAP